MSLPKRDKFGKFLSSTKTAKSKSKTTKKVKAVNYIPTHKPAPKVKVGTTHAYIILDESGSMSSIQREAVEAVNKNIISLQDNASKNSLPFTVSLDTFDSRNCCPSIRPHYFKRDITGQLRLENAAYRPYGGTPLFFTVNAAIEKLRSSPGHTSDSFLVQIITDGQDNESTPADKARFVNLLKEIQATDKWTLAFMLPKGYKDSFCKEYNVPTGNVIEWETSEKGLQQLSQTLNTSNAAYSVLRSAGQTYTHGYFQTDLSGIMPKDLKGHLVDLSPNLRKLSVDVGEVPIQDFCVNKLGNYTLGSAFYMVTKDEKVAANKEILIAEKNSTKVYGGTEARNLIGLPLNQNVKIRPGNHANYDLYVQSTSTNRKLVRGTKLLVKVK